MEEENEAILIAMIIGAVILGIGLAMFFNRPFTGYGAVVLAIGLMTLSLILSMRAEEIIRLRIIPTAASSRNMTKDLAETTSSAVRSPQLLSEQQAQEASEPKETSEAHVEQAPEVLEVEEAQQPPETEPYTPSERTGQTPQETYYPELEQEEEGSGQEREPVQAIEIAPSSSEQSQET